MNHICDCGQHYNSSIAVNSCQANNHGGDIGMREARDALNSTPREYRDESYYEACFELDVKDKQNRQTTKEAKTMTDLEMTKLCADAINYKIDSVVGDCCYHYNANGSTYKYDPIHDDAQAMALVKKLRLTVMAAPLTGWIVHGGEDAGFTKATSTDLNRAIVECVAKINKKE